MGKALAFAWLLAGLCAGNLEAAFSVATNNGYLPAEMRHYAGSPALVAIHVGTDYSLRTRTAMVSTRESVLQLAMGGVEKTWKSKVSVVLWQEGMIFLMVKVPASGALNVKVEVKGDKRASQTMQLQWAMQERPDTIQLAELLAKTDAEARYPNFKVRKYSLIEMRAGKERIIGKGELIVSDVDRRAEIKTEDGVTKIVSYLNPPSSKAKNGYELDLTGQYSDKIAANQELYGVGGSDTEEFFLRIKVSDGESNLEAFAVDRAKAAKSLDFQYLLSTGRTLSFFESRREGWKQIQDQWWPTSSRKVHKESEQELRVLSESTTRYEYQ